ncbi:hypothetical protein Ae201684P_000280 [Aphanomyces euteiches]|nr:hypothetical protein Ae201684P_000280 [Aphanomyces euteiches]
MFALRQRPAVTAVASFARRQMSTKTEAKPSSSLWQTYLKLLETHPLTTKAITSAGIAGTGDFICQTAFESKPFDVRRFVTFTTLGGVFIAPTLHVWYGFLNRVVVGTTTKAVATRLVLDQFVFSPTFLATFFGVLLVVSPQGMLLVLGIARLKTKCREIGGQHSRPTGSCGFQLNCAILHWFLLPLLFSNVVGLFWNAYMSYISYKPVDNDTKTSLE